MFDDTLLVGDHSTSLVFPVPGVLSEQARLLYRGELNGDCNRVEGTDRLFCQQGQAVP